jgi:hypothetical protein
MSETPPPRSGPLQITRDDIVRLAAKPVAVARHRTIEEQLAALVRAFPAAVSHQRAFRVLGSEFVYANRVDGHANLWLTLVRFSGAVEEQFGLTREVAVFYSAFADLQRRTMEAIKQIVTSQGAKGSSREITTHVAMLYSPDPTLNRKLTDWQTTASLAMVPLSHTSDGDEGAMVILESLAEQLYRVNPFPETLPVTGDNFFGRRALLKELLDDSSRGRVSGVFGLRKSGKSSVVQEMARLVRATSAPGNRRIFEVCDLEKVPSPPENPVPTVLRSLRGLLLTSLKRDGLRTHELAALPEIPDVAGFGTALSKILTHCSDVRVVLALDEIEFLAPQFSDPPFEEPMIGQFLSSLRSVAQETNNFSIVFSGLTSAILEEGRLHGRPNPFFAFANTHYLASLPRIDMDRVVKVLASRTGLTFGDEACSTLYQLTDGHPYLARTLAAATVDRMPIALSRPAVEAADVAAATATWRRSMSGWGAETFGSLVRYYPEESAVLDMLIEDITQFDELDRAFPAQIGRLVSLGLVVEVDSDLRRLSPLLDLRPRRPA